jgi:glycine betaine/proline transport system ATP-binding protein
VLQKTIVFITHDFDEAIRLADRIAIMKDGAVVQAGTPQEIVLHPATPYVAEFTRNVPKAKVVQVAALMRPETGNPATGTSVPARATIAEAAPILADVNSIGVVDAAGKRVGVLHRADVADLMMRG